jgi:hypothetical protein
MTALLTHALAALAGYVARELLRWALRRLGG